MPVAQANKAGEKPIKTIILSAILWQIQNADDYDDDDEEEKDEGDKRRRRNIGLYGAEYDSEIVTMMLPNQVNHMLNDGRGSYG